jgi:manganese/zinc/iron transport system permease protein
VSGLEEWTWEVDGWIVAIGALAGLACSIPGTWLVARREAMMADALSHAVLPGIAIAFLATGSRRCRCGFAPRDGSSVVLRSE